MIGCLVLSKMFTTQRLWVGTDGMRHIRLVEKRLFKNVS